MTPGNSNVNEPDKIKLALVDDHTLLRDGMASMLREVDDMQVIASLSSGEELINKFRELNPDLVLMDIVMKGMTGIEATRWIKDYSTTVRIILVSAEIKKELITAGIQAGIEGYLPKDVEKEVLIKAIRSVMSGEKYFNEAVTTLVFEDFYNMERGGKKSQRISNEGLTHREHEILELVAQGVSNKEIGERLFISVRTVETHKTHILDKLGLRNTAELIKYAIKHNIITV